MRLKDKIAVVTGGGQGIGRGIVLCLAEEGADIAVIEINPEAARKVTTEVEEMGRRSLAIVADATDSDSVAKSVQEIINHFGRIDILVNNVGGTDEGGPDSIALGGTGWDGFYRLTLKSHVLMSQAVIPHLREQKSGKIINISSEAGRVGSPLLMAYSAFKSGVISLTKSLALQLASDNINVNCICPGVIWTPLWERLAQGMIAMNPAYKDLSPREFFEKQVVARRPMGREETPEDIGRTVVFFASEDARAITGQSLNVNGGNVMN
jgi:NAD(P)-dependent dehydrogenase (short-subunit alcohol dehydrogenase family)